MFMKLAKCQFASFCRFTGAMWMNAIYDNGIWQDEESVIDSDSYSDMSGTGVWLPSSSANGTGLKYFMINTTLFKILIGDWEN